MFCALQLPLIFWGGLLKFMKIVTFYTICCVQGGNQGVGCRPGSREHPHSVTAPPQPSFPLPGFAFLSKDFSCRAVVWSDQPRVWFGYTSPGSLCTPCADTGVWNQPGVTPWADRRGLGSSLGSHPGQTRGAWNHPEQTQELGTNLGSSLHTLSRQEGFGTSLGSHPEQTRGLWN